MIDHKNYRSKTQPVGLPRIGRATALTLVAVLSFWTQVGCSSSRPDLKMLITECRALVEKHHLSDGSLQYVSGYMNRADSVKLVYETTSKTQVSANCLLQHNGNIDIDTTKLVWAEKSKAADGSAKR